MVGGHGEGGLHLACGHHGVGGDHAQHGGQLRGDHAGALDHAADLPTGGTVQFHGLRLGVGGHDGVRGVGTGFSGAGKSLISVLRAGEHIVERQQFADQTGRAHRDVGAVAADEFGHGFGGFLRLREAGFTGAGVRTAGVQDDGLQFAIRHDLAGPLHGGRAETVRGEHACGRVQRTVVDDEGEILLALHGRDSGFDACGGKALCESNAHGATPILVRPWSSGRPRAMFRDCTA